MPDSAEHERQIEIINQQKTKEECILNGARSMLELYKEGHMRSRMESVIAKIESRIGFLCNEIDRLRAMEGDSTKREQRLTSLECWSSAMKLSLAKISQKIIDLEYKQSAQKELLMAHNMSKQLILGSSQPSDSVEAQRMHTGSQNKDAERLSRIQHDIGFSNSVLRLLDESLRKYRSLFFETQIGSECLLQDRKFFSTAKLVIKLLHADDLDEQLSTRGRPGGYCEIWIGNEKRATSKQKDDFRWNEEFKFSVEKQTDMDIYIFDKKGHLLGFLLIKLYDCQGFQDQLEHLELEPRGSISLQITCIGTPSESPSRVQRRNVCRPALSIVAGHELQVSRFFRITKCAVCTEFILGTTVLQCRECLLMCHQKCSDNLRHVCTLHSGPKSDGKRHQFSVSKSAFPGFCAQCGLLMSFGSRKVMRCKECYIHCHEACQRFVPDSCNTSGSDAKGRRHASLVLQSGPLRAPAEPSYDKCQKMTNSMQKIDDYELIRTLGRGNFGKVVLARERATGLLFAIKILKKQYVLENNEECSVKGEKMVLQLARKDNHPFLVKLHCCFQSKDRLFFVMQYAPGGDLMGQIQRRMFSEKQATFYSAEVLLVLDYLHSKNILYRDLKLDNVLLNADGHILLADFGLSKDGISFGRTTKTFCGTPEFMAPEMLQNGIYTRAVDWWAFGVLVYEMLVGRAPFKGDDEDSLFQSILTDSPAFPDSVHLAARSLIGALLEKDPKLRLGSSEDGALQVKAHPFFSSIDFDALLKKRVGAPFIPIIRDPLDTSNFDDEFTSTSCQLTVADRDDHVVTNDSFKDFDSENCL